MKQKGVKVKCDICKETNKYIIDCVSCEKPICVECLKHDLLCVKCVTKDEMRLVYEVYLPCAS